MFVDKIKFINKVNIKIFICFLQRNDIAMAISKFDQFDFLIDIVPRDELKPTKRQVSKVVMKTSIEKVFIL